MPHRIQWTRWQGVPLPPNTVNVQRPYRWGNPFDVRTYGREQALWLFGAHLATTTTEELRALLQPQRGKDLACACAVDEACHADLWLRLANL